MQPQLPPFRVSEVALTYIQAPTVPKKLSILTEAFRAMQFEEFLRRNPGDQTARTAYLNILKERFTGGEDEWQNPSLFEADRVYTISKPGTFGRSLERSTKINSEGLYQFEEKKEPKLKPIKSFINRVEGFGEKDNDGLPWASQGRKLPFRVVLKDQSDNSKAIYLKTRAQADRMRTYFCLRYNTKDNFDQTFRSISFNFASHEAAIFTESLLAQHRKRKPAPAVNSPSPNSMRRGNERLSSLPEPSRVSSNLQSKRPLENQAPTLLNSVPPQAVQPSLMQYPASLASTSPPPNSSNNDPFNTNGPPQFTEPRASRNALMPQEPLPLSTPSAPPNVNPINQLASLLGTNNDKFKTPTQNTSEPFKPNLTTSVAGGNIDGQKRAVMNNLRQGATNISNQSIDNAILKTPFDSSRRGNNNSGIVHQLSFLEVQFLNQKDFASLKPILQVELIRNGVRGSKTILKSLLKAFEPNLCYKLANEAGSQAICLYSDSLLDHSLKVTVQNILSETLYCTSQIDLSKKILSPVLQVTSPDGMLKLKLKLNTQVSVPSNEQQTALAYHFQKNQKLKIPPLPPAIAAALQKFSKGGVSSSYYAEDKGFQLYSKLDVQTEPASWFLGLSEQDYSILNALKNAGQVIGFCCLRAFVPIVEAMKQIFSDLDELFNSFLTIITTYMRPYFFSSELGKISVIQRLIGFNEEINFPLRMNLEMAVLRKIFSLELPALWEKFERRNIQIVPLLYSYNFELFSRNFLTNELIHLWNYLFQEPELIQLHLLLLAVVLLKNHQSELMDARRNCTAKTIFQSKVGMSAEKSIRTLVFLKDKYFNNPESILDQIKKIFIDKPFQKLLDDILEEESAKINNRKTSKFIDKTNLISKINPETVELPEYQRRKYCLHLFFVQHPTVAGSLYLKCDGVEYECVGYQKTRYYIIPEVGSSVRMEFIDNKSNEYSAELQLSLGIDEFTIDLLSGQKGGAVRVSYIAGLLTDSQIDLAKNNKRIDYFVGASVTSPYIYEEFLRPISNSMVVQNPTRFIDSREDFQRKIRGLFSVGNRSFNQVQFTLFRIACSNHTLEDKIELVEEYADKIAQQQFLCQSLNVRKLFLRKLIELLGFPINNQEFEAQYADLVDIEFNAPKIIKCRYLPEGKPQQALQLEAEAHRYMAEKSVNSLSSDLLIQDLFNYLRSHIEAGLGKLERGEFRVLYSTYGNVQIRSYQVELKKQSKQLTIDFLRAQAFDGMADVSNKHPEVLATQIMPTFSNISKVLQMITTERRAPVDVAAKINNNREKAKTAQSVNVFQRIQSRLARTIKLRFKTRPKLFKHPLFEYYHDLTANIVPPRLGPCYINEVECSLKVLCTMRSNCKVSTRSSEKSLSVNKEFGLYFNIRRLGAPQGASLYFTKTVDTDDADQLHAKMFMNYGYGVYRWEDCLLMGQKQAAKKSKKGAIKKEYKVYFNSREHFVRDYELKAGAKMLQRLMNIQESPARNKNERGQAEIASKLLTRFGQ